METMTAAEYRKSVRKDRKTPAQRQWATINQPESAARLQAWRDLSRDQRIARGMASHLAHALLVFVGHGAQTYARLTGGDEFDQIAALIQRAQEKLAR